MKNFVKKSKLQSCKFIEDLIFANAAHWQRKCFKFSSSSPHILYMLLSAQRILYIWACRPRWPVRIPVNPLISFLSNNRRFFVFISFGSAHRILHVFPYPFIVPYWYMGVSCPCDAFCGIGLTSLVLQIPFMFWRDSSLSRYI